MCSVKYSIISGDTFNVRMEKKKSEKRYFPAIFLNKTALLAFVVSLSFSFRINTPKSLEKTGEKKNNKPEACIYVKTCSAKFFLILQDVSKVFVSLDLFRIRHAAIDIDVRERFSQSK